MNLSVGIVGLPNAGKSTLFNALLGRQVARAENYPFCTIEPNTGVVEVPDENLPVLAKIEKSQQIVPAVVKFVDIAGLVKGAAKGEGLGNKFLAHIREVDLICYLLRAFVDDNVENVGVGNPRDDLKILQTELALKDLETINRVLEEKVHPENKEEVFRRRVAEKVASILNEGKLVANFSWSKEEKEMVKSFFLFTAKPSLVVLNISEADYQKIAEIKKEFADLNPLLICAKTEEELTLLSPEEQKEYLKSLGAEKSGLELLIKEAYANLGLVSFYTAGEKEARAWTIEKSAKAPQAAGVIHSDFEKNFIKAEIINLDDFIAFGGWKACRALGKTRFEGRDYEFVGKEVVEFKIGR
ncbi:redox-regulated ATPase YchF [Candidatus Shapirobacteria bacterium]|nr:redox-regulated ATPase YchF [Candidatus Shapirobacteria bacterium]